MSSWLSFDFFSEWLGLHDVPREFIHQLFVTIEKIPETK